MHHYVKLHSSISPSEHFIYNLYHCRTNISLIHYKIHMGLPI